MSLFAPLFKTDSKGKTRFWRIEVAGDSYRSEAGLLGGKGSPTGWTKCEAKNVGRSNETTAFEQAIAEKDAAYAAKLKRGYVNHTEDLDKVTMFKPMLATDYKKIKSIDFNDYVCSQPKLDGIRCIAKSDGLWTRTGQPIGVSAAHIWDALRPYFEAYPDDILDGELYNHELKDDFDKIVSLVRKEKPDEDRLKEMEDIIQYHIYDCSGKDHFYPRNVNMKTRLKGEWSDSKGFPDCVHIVETETIERQADLDESNEHWLDLGYEGQIIRINEPYKNTRSKGLIKRKVMTDEEFTVLDITEGNGNWAGCAKRVLLDLGDGIECEAGMRGTQEFARKLLINKDKYIGGQATTQYFGKTKDGKLRFGVVKKFYEGKRDM